jgi:hypothetical protein
MIHAEPVAILAAKILAGFGFWWALAEFASN